jgi:2',3'-cyclic-nucleotide 2'-phosphodiesterase (5'-nucleotidase family)
MMKNKTTLGFWLILASLTLTGCGVSLSSQSASSSALTSSFTPSSATTSSSENTSTTPISSSSGSGSTAVTSVSKDGVYQFYAVNDFHGSVLENSSYYYEGGLAKVGGKLKALKAADPEHTFIISSGDMWQGSLESNSNYGALVTEVMNNIGFDSMTIGNHEFDYGQSYIQTNRKAANFPFLAGNIRTYSNVVPSARLGMAAISPRSSHAAASRLASSE